MRRIHIEGILHRVDLEEYVMDNIQLFEDQPIRTAWVEDEEEWYFSIVDVVGVLTEQMDYQNPESIGIS